MRIWHYIFLAVFLCAPACNFDDENYYKLVIMSYGDGFIGTYTIDSDLYVIKDSEVIPESGIWTYSKGLGSLISLEVDIVGKTFSTSFLKVVLYQNEQMVASRSATPGDNNRDLILSFTYTAAEAGKN